MKTATEAQPRTGYGKAVIAAAVVGGIPRKLTSHERDAAEARLRLLEPGAFTTGLDFGFGGRRP